MYAFTNHFSGSALRQRIGMINRRRSGYFTFLRYAVVLLLVVGTAFACQFVRSEVRHKYVQQTGNELFALITAQSTDSDLDTIRRVFRRHGVRLRYDTVVQLSDGRIRQIELSTTVPQTGHAMHTSVGSPYGQGAIQAVGLHLKRNKLLISSVTDEFPHSLQDVAEREGSDNLREFAEVNLKRDFNTVLGFYRVFYRNDFMESSHFGLRKTLVYVTPNNHLDLYPEFAKAILLLDGKEINRDQLRQLPALDVRKVTVYQGDAAQLRYGNRRAQTGLVLLTSWPNEYLKTYYATTPLLRQVYPELFANY